MNNKKRCKISISKQSFSVHSFFVRPAIMGGANGVWGGDNVPHFWDQRGTGGRSNENDLCFYSRQSLFSTVQV